MSGRSTMTMQRGTLWAFVAALAVSFAIAMGFGLAAPAQAQAAQGDNTLIAGDAQISTQTALWFRDRDDIWVGDKASSSLANYLDYDAADPTVLKIKSSNSSVLKVVKRDSFKNMYSYDIVPMKVGTAKLTFKYRDAVSKKTETISKTYTVKAFSNGIASIKFNGKALPKPTAKSAMSEYDLYQFKGKSAKLDIQTQNGWTLEYINAYVTNDMNSKDYSPENAKSISVPKGYDVTYYVGLYKESTGEYFYYTLNVYRNKPVVLVKSLVFVNYPKGVAFNQCGYDGENAKVVNVKSSKPGVIAVSYKKNKGIEKIVLKAKKSGTSKITVKYKAGKKTYTASATYTAATHPLKSVKVNGKAINLKKNSQGIFYANYKKASAQVKAVAGNGWSIKEMSTFKNGKKIKVKNGGKVTVKKGQYVPIRIDLKKGKLVYTYYVDFERY